MLRSYPVHSFTSVVVLGRMTQDQGTYRRDGRIVRALDERTACTAVTLRSDNRAGASAHEVHLRRAQQDCRVGIEADALAVLVDRVHLLAVDDPAGHELVAHRVDHLVDDGDVDEEAQFEVGGPHDGG